jgi:DNA invertase Pin-like site-specific DNA recombinase
LDFIQTLSERVEMPQGQKVGYIRVSSLGQNTERQLDGMTLDRTFEDKVSGKSQDRPALQEMLKHVREGDEVFVHSMDRLARSLGDLLHLVTNLTGRGVRVTFRKEAMTFTGDDSTASKLMLSIMGAVAEFERSMILERQREGIAIAKAKGAYKGRKPSWSPEQVKDLRARASAGEKKTAIAAYFGVSRETVYQCLRSEPVSGQ